MRSSTFLLLILATYGVPLGSSPASNVWSGKPASIRTSATWHSVVSTRSTRSRMKMTSALGGVRVARAQAGVQQVAGFRHAGHSGWYMRW